MLNKIANELVLESLEVYKYKLFRIVMEDFQIFSVPNFHLTNRKQ